MPLQSVVQTTRDAMAPDDANETSRRCVVTRLVRPKAELIRFVASPDGEIVPDLKQTLPGRGVWVTGAHDLVAQASRRNLFAKALKSPVKVSADLADLVGRMLNEAALRSLSLANKAGAVSFGFEAVEAGLRRGRVLALIHAKDAAPDGCRKLDGKFRAIAGEAAHSPVCAFTADELSLASGRPNVVHAALAQGGAADAFVAAADRVERYRRGACAF
jgi:uncharacterized protein